MKTSTPIHHPTTPPGPGKMWGSADVTELRISGWKATWIIQYGPKVISKGLMKGHSEKEM